MEMLPSLSDYFLVSFVAVPEASVTSIKMWLLCFHSYSNFCMVASQGLVSDLLSPGCLALCAPAAANAVNGCLLLPGKALIEVYPFILSIMPQNILHSVTVGAV